MTGRKAGFFEVHADQILSMITLNLFAVLVGFAASVGLWRIFLASPKEHALTELAAGLGGLIGTLVGARAGYVLMNFEYFSQHMDLAPRFWQGGLNAFGGVAGFLVFSTVSVFIIKKERLAILDRLCLVLMPIATAAWLGLWGEGIAYGPAMPQGATLSLPTPDETGAIASRFPLQLAAGLSLLLLLILVERLTQKTRPGWRFAWLGLTLSVHTLAACSLRADTVRLIAGFKNDQFFSLVLTALFLLAAAVLWLIRVKKGDKIKVETGRNEGIA